VYCEYAATQTWRPSRHLLIGQRIVGTYIRGAEPTVSVQQSIVGHPIHLEFRYLPFMRIIFGLLSGLIGALAGWFGLAFLVISLAGPDRDGGIAMGAFFFIGPIGGLVGFVAGVLLFVKTGIVRKAVPSPDAEGAGAATRPRTHISRPFAVCVLIIVGGLAWSAWYELIRSPYLTHGFMTLDLQFRLPPGMTLPPDKDDVQIDVGEAQRHAIVSVGENWRGHDGDRQVILATASLMYKASQRIVTLTLPGGPPESWRLDLSSDPDPTPGYSTWRLPSSASATKLEMSFRLRADR
jgi:hypothetical protein